MERFLVELLPIVLSYVAGIAMVTVEVFIPGFGLPGISGVILLLVGGWLTAKTFSLGVAILVMVIVVAVLAVVIFVFLRSASNGRLKQSPFFLKAQEEMPEKKKGQISVGRKGRTITALRPAGIALFDNVRADVVADGEFIQADVPVTVTEVRGNRIVVKAA